MLQVISPLKDTSWKVRWLVIDCGIWLVGRKVLIHPSAISRQDLEQQEFCCRADEGPG
jgi:hypothetical protein